MEEFDESAGASAPADKVAALEAALEEAICLEEAVEQMESDLSAAKKALHHIRSVRVPDLMEQLGIEGMKFRGWDVSLNDFVSGSLPKDPAQQHRALEWLEHNGGSGLIKSDVVVSFGREHLEDARRLAEEMADAGYRMEMKTGVHPQTLAAFARELIREGKQFDPDLLGLFTGKVARFKRAS